MNLCFSSAFFAIPAVQLLILHQQFIDNWFSDKQKRRPVVRAPLKFLALCSG
jgi:hypothetical protein